MFGTSNFGTEVTSAPTCGLRHPTLTSAPSSIGMLTSAPCKTITCAEVNDLCRSYFVPKLMKFFEIGAEVRLPAFSPGAITIQSTCPLQNLNDFIEMTTLDHIRGQNGQNDWKAEIPKVPSDSVDKIQSKILQKKFFYHNAFNFHVSNASLVKTQSKLLIRCLVRMSH